MNEYKISTPKLSYDQQKAIDKLTGQEAGYERTNYKKLDNHPQDTLGRYLTNSERVRARAILEAHSSTLGITALMRLQKLAKPDSRFLGHKEGSFSSNSLELSPIYLSNLEDYFQLLFSLSEATTPPSGVDQILFHKTIKFMQTIAVAKLYSDLTNQDCHPSAIASDPVSYIDFIDYCQADLDQAMELVGNLIKSKRLNQDRNYRLTVTASFKPDSINTEFDKFVDYQYDIYEMAEIIHENILRNNSIDQLD
ncbi:MAG: hypothetical protein WCK98_06555 [bacterium]